MATARSTGSPMSSAELVRLNWSSSSINGNGADRFLHTSNFTRSSVSCPRVAQPRAMGNKNEGKGIFAPLVVVTRNVMGKKEFNQLRGKAIALHSQVRRTCSCSCSSNGNGLWNEFEGRLSLYVFLGLLPSGDSSPFEPDHHIRRACHYGENAGEIVME